jgi:hypothetical protein
LKYIEEIDLLIGDRIYQSFNDAHPSWARVGTFVECEAWYFDTNNKEGAIRCS